MDFDKVHAEWILGLFPRDKLPELAAEAMVNGFEGPFILDLVGYAPPSFHWLKDEVVEGAFREMGRPPVSRRDAVRRLAQITALEILRNQLSPYEGAKRIWSLEWICGALEFPSGLLFFIGCASEIEDSPECTRFYEQRIIELAWDLIGEDPS